MITCHRWKWCYIGNKSSTPHNPQLAYECQKCGAKTLVAHESELPVTGCSGRLPVKLDWIKGPIAIFDVESVGLHGKGFAVSMILAQNLTESWHATWACLPDISMGAVEDLKWVKENVTYPADTIWLGFPQQVRTGFWQKWLELREEKYLLCSDVTWPVETNFLSACVRDDPGARAWQGPYPLIDVNTLHLLGDSPQERLPEHLPTHNPLADCRHSLRQLAAVLDPR